MATGLTLECLWQLVTTRNVHGNWSKPGMTICNWSHYGMYMQLVSTKNAIEKWFQLRISVPNSIILNSDVYGNWSLPRMYMVTCVNPDHDKGPRHLESPCTGISNGNRSLSGMLKINRIWNVHGIWSQIIIKPKFSYKAEELPWKLKGLPFTIWLKLILLHTDMSIATRPAMVTGLNPECLCQLNFTGMPIKIGLNLEG